MLATPPNQHMLLPMESERGGDYFSYHPVHDDPEYVLIYNFGELYDGKIIVKISTRLNTMPHTYLAVSFGTPVLELWVVIKVIPSLHARARSKTLTELEGIDE